MEGVGSPSQAHPHRPTPRVRPVSLEYGPGSAHQGFLPLQAADLPLVLGLGGQWGALRGTGAEGEGGTEPLQLIEKDD